MSRLRPALAVLVFALVLLAALPTAGWAQRDSGRDSATVSAEGWGAHLAGSVLSWGRGALTWLRALINAEHGTIVYTPVVPPTP